MIIIIIIMGIVDTGLFTCPRPCQHAVHATAAVSHPMHAKVMRLQSGSDVSAGTCNKRSWQAGMQQQTTLVSMLLRPASLINKPSRLRWCSSVLVWSNLYAKVVHASACLLLI
jgi:hypothetical protein